MIPIFILAIVLTIGVSALCSILEAMILSTTTAEIESLKKAHPKRGERLEKARQQIEETSSAILSLNTIANTLGATIVGGLAVQIWANESNVLFKVSLAMTVAILFLSEIIPKNVGVLYRPRLLRAPQTPDGLFVKRMAWTAAQLEVVRGGMYDVVHAESGTGKRVRLDGVEMAAKTGTAQYGDGLKHAWMILFAPYDKPRYAVAMMIENAVSGGITVAPKLRELMHLLLVHDGTLVAPPVIPAGMDLEMIEGEADEG